MLKHALNRLGYYAPDPTVGIVSMTDRAMFEGLKKFQSDRKLSVTGSIHPGDDTETALNRAIEDQPIAAKYIWHTCQDGKVRSAHAAREGKVFSWLDHPIPGKDFNCRCWAAPFTGKKTVDQIYDPPIKPEYPIETIAGLAVGGSLALALRTLNELPRNLNWQDGPDKSAIKWKKQRADRGWESDDDITEALRTGKRHRAYNKLNPDNPAIRYEYKGKYLVRDEVTHDIIHYGAKDFDRPAVPPKGNKP